MLEISKFICMLDMRRRGKEDTWAYWRILFMPMGDANVARTWMTQRRAMVVYSFPASVRQNDDGTGLRCR